MKNILHITSEGLTSKYLGVPSYVGKSKARTFDYVKDRMWKKIQGWKEKLLSKPGKEILIKAVAQAIPVYSMACFDLTKSVCEELSTMIDHRSVTIHIDEARLTQNSKIRAHGFKFEARWL